MLRVYLLLVAVLATVALAACGDDDDNGNGGSATSTASAAATATAGSGDQSLTIYSGRSEQLIAPIIEQFEQETGIDVSVRYGDTAELAATILEEGSNSPADIFFAQDGGALGALALEDMLAELPQEILDAVPAQYRSPDGVWVGISGRSRVVAYNINNVSDDELPESILDFTDPKWNGRIGWAPTNGSLQAFVTALRLVEGDDAAREWLEGIQANNPKTYEGNAPAVEAVGNGEVDVAFVNHYYLYRFLAERGESFPVRNYFFKNGDPGALVNVAGAGVLATSKNTGAAHEFIEYMLSEKGQSYFAEQTYEYPLASGVQPAEDLPTLDELQPPDIDLSDLADLEGTLELMREAGVLP